MGVDPFMSAALSEGRKAYPACLPNPPVGAVLVRSGEIVGRGYTQPPGGAHAEIGALAAVEGDLADATIFVTLEPCSFHGRTPSCAEAIIAAGIRRVVVAIVDPDPRNNGAGIAKLRRAGVEVEVGVMQAEALGDLRPFLNLPANKMDDREPTNYFYANRADVAAERLRGLEAVEDTSTFDQLTELGVGPGWHCLEVGAGAGSVARWLSEKAGPTGRVVATDIDATHLEGGGYEVWRHNILDDALPPDAFDLVHMRHVLIHVDASQHRHVLRALFGTIRAGGGILIEESDLRTWRAGDDIPAALAKRFAIGVETTLDLYRERGMNIQLGAVLARIMTEVGFGNVSARERVREVLGGSAEATFHRLSALQLAGSVRDRSPERAALLDDFSASFEDAALRYTTRTTVSVSARKSP